MNSQVSASGRKLPKLYEKKSDCCGCSACYAICPVSAIFMEFDEEGFFYPLVDENKCIRCYQCIKVCSFKRDKRENMELERCLNEEGKR